MSLILSLFVYRINDITTSFEPPPAFVALAKLEANRKRDMTYPLEFRSKQMAAYPDLGPLTLDLPADEAFKRVVTLAQSKNDWEIISQDQDNLRLEAVVTTSLMRFKDDLVIEVRKENDKSQIHMRSKSRLGQSDLGANAKRINEFFKALVSR